LSVYCWFVQFQWLTCSTKHITHSVWLFIYCTCVAEMRRIGLV